MTPIFSESNQSSQTAGEARRKIALSIEYDGTDFLGWQRQAKGRTVQQTLEEALEDLTGERVRLIAAGRTDAGVHARGQVVHFTTSRAWPAEVFVKALHPRLPDDVGVKDAWETPPGFDARRGANLRVYSYRLWNRRLPPVIERRLWAHYPERLDFDLIREASARLVGEHDFAGFRSSQCRAKRTRLNLERLDWKESEPGLWIMETACRSFLHHMVRVIAGTLIEVGRGAMRLETIDRILETGDRTLAGRTAKPEGLTLERVEYSKRRDSVFS